MSVVGRWVFAGPKGLLDETGNWRVVKFFGDVQLTFGGLQLRPSGYARTSPRDGVALSITEKTLIAWMVIEDLDDTRPGGSALMIHTRSNEQFDAINFGEAAEATWSAGSARLERTKIGPENPVEHETGELVKMAITYRDAGDGLAEISLYRNDVLVQSYQHGKLAMWNQNDVEVLFGARHVIGTEVHGHMNATIVAAEIHNACLTPAELAHRQLPERDASATIPDPMLGLKLKNKTAITVHVEIHDVMDGTPLVNFSIKAGAVHTSSLDFPPPMPASRPQGMPAGPSARLIVAADPEMQQLLADVRLDWMAPRMYAVTFEASLESPSGHRLVVKG